MRALLYVVVILSSFCICHRATAAPFDVLEANDNSYDTLSGRPCIQECQARCGGICYLNMMAFKYICSCSRMSK